MISILGLIDGLTAMGIVVSSIIFGFISISKGKRLGAKLLKVVGIVSIFIGCFWLGPTLDLFLVVFAQTNIAPIELYPLLSYMWVAPATVASMYLGAELLAPDKKKVIVVVYTIIGIVFELFLWLQPKQAFDLTLGVPGEDLIDASFNRTHILYILILLLLVSILVFLVIGSLVKVKQSSGEIRKKFIYITIAFTIFLVTAIADTLLSGPIIAVFRTAMMTFAIWLYLGLKT